MGPWSIGRWYWPLAALSVAWCLALIVVGMQPPNERSIWVVGIAAVLMAIAWFGWERRRFPGPPRVDRAAPSAESIRSAEAAVGEEPPKGH